MRIVTSEQMRGIDRRATEQFGIPSLVLMENAAIAVVDAVQEQFAAADRVAIFCGSGQNGGDGFAVARHLENRGVVPIVLLVGGREKLAGDALINFEICRRLAITIHDITDAAHVEDLVAHAADADLVIDAIFGTGLNRAPAGVYAEVIRAIAELRLPVLSIDLPSGANASTGEVFDPCIRAEVTVTFAAPKLCHVFEPAAVYCGEIIVADISIPEAAFDDENVTLALTTSHDVAPLCAPRLAATHKGTWGHVAIVAGSFGRSGAAVLCARGAIRTGAGLVTVATDPYIAAIVNAGSIESMTYPIALERHSLPALLDFLQGRDAVLVGPGLRDEEDSYEFIRQLVTSVEQPLVVDASGLNAFAGRIEELNPMARQRVITPHPGELARLLASDTKTINAGRLDAVREAARRAKCVVVLKGHQTLIGHPDGHVNVNPTGNPGMGSGGMGDVLGGVIAALLARGIDPFEAACAGVYVHGLAGDLVQAEIGDTGLAALDLAEKLPRAIHECGSSLRHSAS